MWLVCQNLSYENQKNVFKFHLSTMLSRSSVHLEKFEIKDHIPNIFRRKCVIKQEGEYTTNIRRNINFLNSKLLSLHLKLSNVLVPSDWFLLYRISYV